KDHIVRMLQFLAEDVRRQLAFIGASSLDALVGRVDLLVVKEHHQTLIESRGVDLSYFNADEGDQLAQRKRQPNPFNESINEFNQTYLALCERAIEEESEVTHQGTITTQDRAALATLSGRIAAKVSKKRVAEIREKGRAESDHRFNGSIELEFTGS